MMHTSAFLRRSHPARTSALLLAGILAAGGYGLLPGGFAPASVYAQGAANEAALQILRVERGGRIAVPLKGVTRVVPVDEDIARGRYDNGQVLIEGITTGITIIEVEQGTGVGMITRQFEVEVLDSRPAEDVTLLEGTIPIPTIGTPDTPTIGEGDLEIEDMEVVEGPARAQLTASLSVEPAEDNPSQALFTITYGNGGRMDASDVVLRYTLDDSVSYITNSATRGGEFNSGRRELSWRFDEIRANTLGQTVSFRVAALNTDSDRFFSYATIEDASGAQAKSNSLEYSFVASPLLTVFALPDRIIEGRNAPIMVDVRGTDYQAAIDRLQKIGVLIGTGPGVYNPADPTHRSAYTVMILRALNLRDLRDKAAIRFVLSRRSVVTLDIRNSDGRIIAPLLTRATREGGEHTMLWNGRTKTGFAAPGRYSYVCSARDAKGVVTSLKGYINVIPQTPLQPSGRPSFVDVRSTDWYAGFLSLAERQGLIEGYPNKQFRPLKPINREEATAIIVRAIGLEDLTKRYANKDSGFLDDHQVSGWAKPYVYIASAVAKTSSGDLIVGSPNNMYNPMRSLRRDEAALVVQRLVDKETNRKLYVSGQMVPGTIVSINSKNVQAADDGTFSLVIEQNTSAATNVAVIDRRR